MNKIINAASQGNSFDRSPDTMNAMRRARETLEIRFNKLERCYNRIMDLVVADDLFEHYEKELGAQTAKYTLGIQGMGDLMIAMNPPAAQHAQNLGNTQTLRPVEALRPSFTLSFDSSPTELAAWMSQFRAYHEASKLHTVYNF